MSPAESVAWELGDELARVAGESVSRLAARVASGRNLVETADQLSRHDSEKVREIARRVKALGMFGPDAKLLDVPSNGMGRIASGIMWEDRAREMCFAFGDVVVTDLSSKRVATCRLVSFGDPPVVTLEG